MPGMNDADWLSLAETQLRALEHFGNSAAPTEVETALVHAFYDGKITTQGRCRTWFGHDFRVKLGTYVWDPDRIRVAWGNNIFARWSDDSNAHIFKNVHARSRELKRWFGAPPAERFNEPAVYRTGLVGRPTSWHLIEVECRRRWASGERHTKVGIRENAAEWARVLVRWLKDAHRQAPVPSEKSLTSGKLPGLLRQLASGPELHEL